MRTHINPTIEIAKAKKNKNYAYFTEFVGGKLVIKAKSKSGRSRGKVGEVKETGEIFIDERGAKFLTPDLVKKLQFAAGLLYSKEISKTKIVIKKSTVKKDTRLVTISFTHSLKETLSINKQSVTLKN